MPRRSLLLLLPALLVACLDPIAPDVGPPIARPTCDDDLDPALTVSFRTDIKPILDRACKSCHKQGGTGFEIGGLDVDTYESLRAGGLRSTVAIIIDGEPCTSVLWQKIGPAPPYGARMPRDDAPLPQAEIDLIHDWIAEGALDD